MSTRGAFGPPAPIAARQVSEDERIDADGRLDVRQMEQELFDVVPDAGQRPPQRAVIEDDGECLARFGQWGDSFRCSMRAKAAAPMTPASPPSVASSICGKSSASRQVWR